MFGEKNAQILANRTIDEVLKLTLETPKPEEILDTPQIWKTDKPATDISAAIE